MGYAELAVSGLFTTSLAGLEFYLIMPAPRVDNLEDLSKIKYFWGYMRGSISGIETSEMTRFAFKEDIRRLRDYMEVVAADSGFVDDDVLDTLIERLKERRTKGVEIKPSFIVGPDTGSKRLQGLAEEGLVSVQTATLNPPVNIRIVDNNYTFVSGDGRYCWSFGNVGAVRDRDRAIKKLESEIRSDRRFREALSLCVES